MKKNNILALGLSLGIIMLGTSCNDDENTPVGPSLSVEELNSNSTGGEITITQGSNLIFAWDARKGETNLSTMTVNTDGVNASSPLPSSSEGNTFPYTVANSDNALYLDTMVFTNGGTNLGRTTYTFTITDGISNTRSVQYGVTVVESSNLLSEPMDFTWTRQAGANGVGLAQFGLKWTSNTTQNAIVTIDGSTTMVELPASAWVNITTDAELEAAIAAATPITQYDNVSVTQSALYNDVLGVLHNGTAYILNIQEGTITSVSTGTNAEIKGKYRS